VTIRLRGSHHLFGEVVAGRMCLSSAGRMASRCWEEIPKHFPSVTLDTFVVMPDHMYGIIVIGRSPVRRNVGAQHAAPLHSPARALSTVKSLHVVARSLGAIIRGLKSATTKRINEMQGTPGKKVWQRNYYDRIIRSDGELDRARRYIMTNPDRWSKTVNS